jgi:hypothetical protein
MQEARQPRQRMWRVSGTVILGVQLEIEAEKRLQVLEHLGTSMATADMIFCTWKVRGPD